MRVGIIGSRNVVGVTAQQLIPWIPANCTQIVSGGARGIDTLAEEAARQLGIPLLCLRPDYNRYGRQAPLRRNDEILGNCDYVLAFWDYCSRGTCYTITECIRRHIPCRIVEVGKSGIICRSQTPKQPQEQADARPQN